jgi:sigma-B regulation protein RsbU (phosphoserine phosphatase)
MVKILIVEDEPGIAFGLESDLQAEGYAVAVAGDGVEAVRRARAEPFDLILLDVMLPHKDGFEVCRELRQTGLSTPIVMLTAKSEEFDKVLGLDLGADDYITKPFRPRELRARIRAALRHQPGMESPGADLQRQLRVASRVQQRLFPQLSPPLSTLDYVGFCRPAHGMSGDYYDFLNLAPDRLGLLVTDVVGKGIPAALLMASVHGAIRTHAPRFGDRCGEVLSHLNASLYESSDESMFATVFYAVYDESTRVLTDANAGHEPPLLVRQAPGRPVLQPLDALTLPAGMLPSLAPLQSSVQLLPGDWLLIFTDGVTEAADDNCLEFGRERILAVMERNLDVAAGQMRDAILAALAGHTRGVVQADDVTLIAAHVLPHREPANA